MKQAWSQNLVVAHQLLTLKSGCIKWKLVYSNCGFINIHEVPIFIDFVVVLNHKKVMFHQSIISIVLKGSLSTNLRMFKTVISIESTKIDAN